MSPLYHCPPPLYISAPASLITKETFPCQGRANHPISDSGNFFLFSLCWILLEDLKKFHLPSHFPPFISHLPNNAQNLCSDCSISTAEETALLELKAHLVTATLWYNLPQPLPRTLPSTTNRRHPQFKNTWMLKNMSAGIEKKWQLPRDSPPIANTPPLPKTRGPLLGTLWGDRKGLLHYLHSGTPLPHASTKISLFSACHRDPVPCLTAQWAAPVNQDWEDVVGSRGPYSLIWGLAH